MKRILPPLNALKTFESAARLLSFTKAADELYVSQAAVSHQIRHLSEFLNTTLFKRTPRGLELTPEAENLYDVAKRSLDNISLVSQTILCSQRKDVNTLTVRITPFFAKYVLAPIISKFLKRYPDVKLRTVIGRQPLGNDLGTYDVVVSTDEGQWDGIVACPILIDRMIPLCSPELIASKSGRIAPSELTNYVIIRDVYADVCERWLKAAGVSVVEPEQNIFTDDPHFAVEAGLYGEGIFFEAPVFVQSHLKRKKLIMPFGDRYSVPVQYRILHKVSRLKERKVRLFKDWLVKEMQDRANIRSVVRA